MSAGITVTENNASIIAEWCGGRTVVEQDPFDSDKTYPGINVPTENGVERASLGDIVTRTENDCFIIIKRKDIDHGSSY